MGRKVPGFNWCTNDSRRSASGADQANVRLVITLAGKHKIIAKRPPTVRGLKMHYKRRVRFIISESRHRALCFGCFVRDKAFSSVHSGDGACANNSTSRVS